MPDQLLSQAEVDGIRADAEQLFVDSVNIRRPTSPGTLNEATGLMVGPTFDDILIATQDALGNWIPNAAIYPIMSRRDRFDEFGQGLIFTRQYRVDLRWSEDDIQIRDEVIAVFSRDPQLIDRVLQVRDVVVGTNLGYRRLTVHDSRE